MTRRSTLAPLATLALLAGTAVQAGGDAPRGRDKARSCAVCHGVVGIASLPNAPHLAAQPEGYLVEQLKAFRSGQRANEVMAVVARPLSDADIADLAAWYASLRITVEAAR